MNIPGPGWEALLWWRNYPCKWHVTKAQYFIDLVEDGQPMEKVESADWFQCFLEIFMITLQADKRLAPNTEVWWIPLWFKYGKRPWTEVQFALCGMKEQTHLWCWNRQIFFGIRCLGIIFAIRRFRFRICIWDQSILAFRFLFRTRSETGSVGYLCSSWKW